MSRHQSVSDFEAWDRLRPLLRPGEQLLWVGRPDPKVRFVSADLFLVPFSIMWAGFAVFWEWTAIASHAPIFFELWGVPFVLVGLYFTVGRFVYKRRRKLATVYGLTDSRAIMLTGQRSSNEIPLKGTPVRTSRSRDGRHASIVFGWVAGQTMYLNTGLDFYNQGQAQAVAFYDVAEPETLLRALDRLQ